MHSTFSGEMSQLSANLDDFGYLNGKNLVGPEGRPGEASLPIIIFYLSISSVRKCVYLTGVYSKIISVPSQGENPLYLLR